MGYGAFNGCQHWRDNYTSYILPQSRISFREVYPPREKKKKIYLISIGFRVVEPVQEGVELVLPDNLTSLAGDPRLQLTEMMGWKDNADVLHIKGITY